MAEITKELWNIFTYYTISSNPNEPYKITCNQLLRLCKEVLLFEPRFTDIPLTNSQLQVFFTIDSKGHNVRFNFKYLRISSCFLRYFCNIRKALWISNNFWIVQSEQQLFVILRILLMNCHFNNCSWIISCPWQLEEFPIH